jgi:hypothetical protein
MEGVVLTRLPAVLTLWASDDEDLLRSCWATARCEDGRLHAAANVGGRVQTHDGHFWESRQ